MASDCEKWKHYREEQIDAYDVTGLTKQCCGFAWKKLSSHQDRRIDGKTWGCSSEWDPMWENSKKSHTWSPSYVGQKCHGIFLQNEKWSF